MPSNPLANYKYKIGELVLIKYGKSSTSKLLDGKMSKILRMHGQAFLMGRQTYPMWLVVEADTQGNGLWYDEISPVDLTTVEKVFYDIE